MLIVLFSLVCYLFMDEVRSLGNNFSAYSPDGDLIDPLEAFMVFRIAFAGFINVSTSLAFSWVCFVLAKTLQHRNRLSLKEWTVKEWTVVAVPYLCMCWVHSGTYAAFLQVYLKGHILANAVCGLLYLFFFSLLFYESFRFRELDSMLRNYSGRITYQLTIATTPTFFLMLSFF